jgi:hypothetical protein
MLKEGVRSIRHLLVAASATAALLTGSLVAAPAVATLRSAEWSPGDTTREGASAFEVLICAAKLQQTKAPAGIVGTGNRHGLFLTGAERALHDLSLRGVSIAKLPRGGDLAADPEGIFLDASGLTEAQATAVLTHCLELHGAPPAVADAAHPTAAELSAIRAHLRPFREAFDVARSPRVAAK